MKSRGERDILALFLEGTPIDRALAAAAREALRRHAQAGTLIPVERRGRIEWLRAEDIDPSVLRSAS